MRRICRSTLLATGLLPAIIVLLHAQGGAPPMDFTHPIVHDSAARRGIPDPVIRAAIATYNLAPNKLSGEVRDANGILGVFEGALRLTGHASGDVVVINGNMRVTAGAQVDGKITVLGGRLTVDPGGTIHDTLVYSETALVDRSGDGTLRVHNNGRPLDEYTSRSFTAGAFQGSGKITLGTYNRVEGFSAHLLPSLTWHVDSLRWLRLDLLGLARTASAEGEKRPILGGEATLTAHTVVPLPLSVGIHAASVISPTADRPFPALESGLSALIFRRDYRDWYKKRDWGIFGDWSPMDELTLRGAIDFSREEGIRAIDAFSIIRSSEAWRQNPLIDDGQFTTLTLGATWDTRNRRELTSDGTYARVELSHISSGGLNPLTLPATIRDEIPSKGYNANEISFDLRQYTRLSPTRAIHLRLTGGGSLGGDPLTLQRRLALGGGDLLPGYAFRAINCDPRRVPDAALPALCDRQMVAQVEYRQTIGLDLATRVASYSIGFHQPDLVLFGDAGSAWLSGAGVGKVPSNSIQSLREWRYDAGVGLDGGLFGIYLAKAITDHEPFRLFIRIGRRF